MCTETFRRLPEEKRKRFLDAAWAEFNRVPIAEVSINQIVQKAGVPRGSFYQYFTDKDDLFWYLMQSVGNHYIGEYRKVIQQAEGDIFRAQQMAFDGLTGDGLKDDPLFERCLRLLQLNPGLPMQLMMEESRENPILAGVRDLLDVSMLVRQDEEYLRQLFYMTLIMLAVAVGDQLVAPEKVEQHRAALHLQLEIIKNGSLKQTAAS